MKYICSILFLIVYMNVKATEKVLPAVDTVPKTTTDTTGVVQRQASASAGVSYGSDISFFGRTGPKKNPYISTDLIINSKPGIFVYGNVFNVLGYQPLAAEVDLGAGYFYTLSKKISGNFAYTHFFFARNAQIIKSVSLNDINLKNNFDWKIFATSIQGDYLFGKKDADDIFVTINNSKYIETSWGIFDNKDYLSFVPTISMIFGTQNFVGKFSDDQIHHRPPPYNVIVSEDLLREIRENRQFSALNYSFKIPVAYNRPHYTFEVSYKYSIPVHVQGYLENHRESFWGVTFYYVFYKDRK
jgi:hypothetical protein